MRWGTESREASRVRVQECDPARECNPMIAGAYRTLDKGCGGR